MSFSFLRCLRGSAIILLLFTGLSACGGKSRALRLSDSQVFAVTADSASFYRYGPQQGNGPDQFLPKDTLMTVIRPSFGYCKVQLLDGPEGYVASDDIRPAPPTLLAALNPPEPDRAEENFDVSSAEPPPPEDLPSPDLPATAVEPLPEPTPE